MTKRLIACLVMVFLFAAAGLSQARRGARPAQVNMKPGYYFTVDMCHACYYPDWAKDIARLFKEKGISATTYEGAMMESLKERFAPVKIFQRRGLWKDVVYVGPFGSEEAASEALDKFPSVLGVAQRKRNKMEGAEGGGWPLSDDERVRRTAGNDYKYGFYEIKGCRLLP
ncbi:MAG TPA: hypothetical protein VF762_01240 [Blastocatellia bacterium]